MITKKGRRKIGGQKDNENEEGRRKKENRIIMKRKERKKENRIIIKRKEGKKENIIKRRKEGKKENMMIEKREKR